LIKHGEIIPGFWRKPFMDYRMCTAYTDGTKLCIEMALLANSIGGLTISPGMLDPRVKDVYEVFQYFNFPSLWDGKTPLVDYVLGAYPPGGVFVVGFSDQPHQMETLGWYPCRLGSGPFYVFHRPYHLGHFETMACVAEAFLDGWAVLQPTHGLLTNVYAYAKKDLRQGDTLDGIGGYIAYGLIENCTDNRSRPGLPICLAENVTLHREIRKDEKILLEDVCYKPSDPRFEIFRLAMQF
jgi:predicted homoserine dehydrogenase-like protein